MAGFIIVNQTHVGHVIGENLLQCEDRSLFSAIFFCDRSKLCKIRKVLDDNVVHCHGSAASNKTDTFVHDGEKDSCSSLMYISHKGECLPYHITREQRAPVCKQFSQCDGFLLDSVFVNDLVIDCSSHADEAVMKSMYVTLSYHFCQSEYQIPCINGHPKCYNITDICVFQLTAYNTVAPCRTGEHMQQCKEFECNMMFKCPDYYCIPWGYVCDGKWDCPQGTEERTSQHCGKGRKCQFLFKCKSSVICLHLNDVCDDKPNCPFVDDEQLCSLHHRICVSSCTCLTNVICCDDFLSNKLLLSDIFNFEIVILSDSKAPASEQTYPLTQTVLLKVYQMNFSMSCSMFKSASKLNFLELNSNNLTQLQTKCLPIYNTLKVLNVVHNRLQFVDQSALMFLQKLLFLNISCNPITSLHVDLFHKLAKTKIISIINISVSEMVGSPEELQALDHLETSDYHFCCFVELESKCSLPIPGYFSCGSLLRTSGLRATILSFAIFVFVSNTIHLVLQYLCYKFKVDKSFANGTIVTVISLSDFIIALAFTFLLCADQYYGVRFGWNAVHWEKSELCFSVNVLFLMFHLLSPSMHSFLAFSRLSVVANPIDSTFKKTSAVQKYILGVFLLCIFASSGFTIAMFLLIPNMAFSLCSPYIDPTHTIIVMQIVTWFTAVFLLLSTLFTIVCHICLTYHLRISQKAVQKASIQKKSNKNLYAKLILTTAVNTLCWVSWVVFHILFMFLEASPQSLLLWAPSVTSPMNSLLMPVLHILGTSRKLCGCKK